RTSRGEPPSAEEPARWVRGALPGCAVVSGPPDARDGTGWALGDGGTHGAAPGRRPRYQSGRQGGGERFRPSVVPPVRPGPGTDGGWTVRRDRDRGGEVDP